MTSTLGVHSFLLLTSMRSAATSSFSMAYTFPSGQHSAIAMETEPVPAPTSYATESGERRSLATESDLTSLLVMGASPLVKSSSGIQTGHAVSGEGFSTTAAQSSPNSTFRSSFGEPETIFSSGYPRFWPMVTVTLGRYSSSSWHSARAPVLPVRRAKVRRLVRTLPVTLNSRPWALVRRTSCQGTPILEQRYATVEIPHSTLTSYPFRASRSFLAPL